MRYEPLEDRIIVRAADPESRTAGGVVLPDVAKDDESTRGTVLAVGPDAEGKLSEGDEVVYSKYAGVRLDGGPGHPGLADEPDALALRLADVIARVAG